MMDESYLNHLYNYELPKKQIAYYRNGRPVYVGRTYKKHGRKAKRK